MNPNYSRAASSQQHKGQATTRKLRRSCFKNRKHRFLLKRSWALDEQPKGTCIGRPARRLGSKQEQTSLCSADMENYGRRCAREKKHFWRTIKNRNFPKKKEQEKGALVSHCHMRLECLTLTLRKLKIQESRVTSQPPVVTHLNRKSQSKHVKYFFQKYLNF